MKRIYVFVMVLLLFGIFACSAPVLPSVPTPLPFVPEPAKSDAMDVPKLYLAFIQDTLVPRYGLSNLNAVRYLQQSAEPLGMDEQCLGLMGALMADLVEDGIDELIVAVCVQKQTVRGPDQVVSVQVYTCTEGGVQQVPGPEDALVSVVSDESTAYFGSEYSLTLCLGEQKLIYSYFQGETGDSGWERHIAYRMEDGKLQKVMDVENLLGAGEYGVVARVLPDWLEEDLRGVSRVSVKAYGENSVLLYAQALNADEFFILPGEYFDIYTSQQQAMDAVLRPMKNASVKQILDEQWQDNTGLLAWLGKPEPSFSPPPLPTKKPAALEDFILQGRNRAYVYEELDAYTQREIALIRNGMYALSGKIFTKQENIAYFSQCSWYVPAAKDVDSLLNANQRANIDLCVQYEKDHGW